MVFVLSTFSKRSYAQKMAKRVIQKRLAGCVLTIPVASLYRWKGKIEDAKEVLAVYKTMEGKAKRLMEFIEENHPYDVPFVAMVPLGRVSKEYRKWFENEIV